MVFNYFGHACFSVEIGATTLLFDPFISHNPLAQGKVDINNIKADYILISHGHVDHMADTMAIAERTGATIIAAYEITSWFEKLGYKKLEPMNFGSITLDFGKVRFVPAWHSSVLPDGTYAGNPGGFVITTTHGNFYYSGDTCLSIEMQLIPKYTQLDVAILPIGGRFTMDVEDAIMAADFIECKKIIGVHYDTFPFINVNTNTAQQAFADAGKELLLTDIGTSISL